jgi:hypothetical protein
MVEQGKACGGLGAPPVVMTAGRIEKIEKGLDVGVVGSFNQSLRLEDIDSNYQYVNE